MDPVIIPTTFAASHGHERPKLGAADIGKIVGVTVGILLIAFIIIIISEISERMGRSRSKTLTESRLECGILTHIEGNPPSHQNSSFVDETGDSADSLCFTASEGLTDRCASGLADRQETTTPSSNDIIYGPKYLDPLVRQTFWNITKSPLLQVSDEILLEIMTYLEAMDLYRLRRTSRRFLYLFSSPQFERYHSAEDYVWKMQDMADLQLPLQDRLIALRSSHCAECFSVIEERLKDPSARTPEVEYLHCSGCRSDHHAHLFSVKELEKPPDERVCIGREGFISICEHRRITYADVNRSVMLYQKFHAIATCREPSHTQDTALSGVLEHKFPTLFYLDSFEQFLLRKTHHYALARGEPSDVSANQLRQFLQDTQQTDPMPWYPLDVPEISPMRNLDPNVCRCVNYEGADEVSWALKKRDPGDLWAKNRCIWSGQYPSGCLKLSKEYSDHRKVTILDELQFTCKLQACSQHHDNCAELDLELSSKGGAPWEPGWYGLLDPDSYGTLGFENITWCQNIGCRNYFRHRVQRPVVHKLRTSLPTINRVCTGKYDCCRIVKEQTTCSERSESHEGNAPVGNSESRVAETAEQSHQTGRRPLPARYRRRGNN